MNTGACVLKGFVPTPTAVVDSMVEKLFHGLPPRVNCSILDPGCGDAAFILGIARWCRQHGTPVPRILGVELHPERAASARKAVADLPTVEIRNEDFLVRRDCTFDYVIGNPPYVPITGLSESERREYRTRYSTAQGRFDLYLLFFEEALRQLKPDGRLVFVTPEKYLYVQTAGPLRRKMANIRVEEIHFIDEQTFPGLTTYPTITSVRNSAPRRETRVLLRSGESRVVELPGDGASWLPSVSAADSKQIGHTLQDACLRISCGVATGADSIFVKEMSALDRKLRPFALPTVAGREISTDNGMRLSHAMLVPYARNGELLQENRLGELGAYLKAPDRRRRLLARTCSKRKPWYAFHENPPLTDILRPKILCKDITARVFFVTDEAGELVPRHSVYYIVPRDPEMVRDLCEYLNSAEVENWLKGHCQRAASGYIRLQSHVLKQIPIPASFVQGTQTAWYDDAIATA